MSRNRILGITLWQPWAWCIYPGPKSAPKRVENRDWSPRPEELSPGDFLAIHAAAFVDEQREAEDARRLRCELGVIVPPTLVRGAIVGVARYDGCEMRARWIGWPGRGPTPDPWFHGPVGWYMGDVVTLGEPVKACGQRKLWELPGPVLAEVRRQFKLVVDGGAEV